MINKFEKEALVIRLLNEGKTIREIATEAHISFKDIGGIARKLKGETEIQQESSTPKSLETQALILFAEGRNQVEVAIALDISTSKVSDIYEEYLRLNSIEDLIEVYEKIKYSLPKFLKLFDAMTCSDMSVEDFVLALSHIHELPYIEQRRDKLLKGIEALTRQTSVFSKNLEYILNQR
jgi:predicted XRE-type DNA-binding protein